MKSSLPSPTKAQLERWRVMQELGCVACQMNGVVGVPADIHHVLSGGRRISHSHVLALCPYHHRSVKPDTKLTTVRFKEIYGPALDANPKEFQQRYGTQQELLEIQEALIQKYYEVTSHEQQE